MRALLALAVLGAAVGPGCVVVERDDDFVIPIYDPCNRTSDCEPRADRCFDITIDYGTHIVNDGMCSVFCADDRDCPSLGACFALDELADPLCYQTCVDDLDCALGFRCVDAIDVRSITPICLPF